MFIQLQEMNQINNNTNIVTATYERHLAKIVVFQCKAIHLNLKEEAVTKYILCCGSRVSYRWHCNNVSYNTCPLVRR